MNNFYLIILLSFSFLATSQDSDDIKHLAKSKFIEGNSKIEGQKYQEAIDLLTEAINLDPSLKGAYKNRGICNSLLKFHDDALNDFNSAIQLDSSDSDLYSYRGFTHAELDQFDSALKDLNTAIKLNPHNTEALLYTGVVYIWLERYDDGINEFNKILKINPNHARAYYNRGIAYEKKGEIAQACFDWGKAKRMDYPLAGIMNEQFCE